MLYCGHFWFKLPDSGYYLVVMSLLILEQKEVLSCEMGR